MQTTPTTTQKASAEAESAVEKLSCDYTPKERRQEAIIREDEARAAMVAQHEAERSYRQARPPI